MARPKHLAVGWQTLESYSLSPIHSGFFAPMWDKVDLEARK
ncbi:MAG TPA: hypothetical protein VLH15_07410 [Dehalococcoidales bacterium]|nr:hypothetical protein [Dehalococcoidales bacterium]